MFTDHCVFLVVNVIHMLFESHLKSSGCLSNKLFTAFIAGDQANNTNCFAISHLSFCLPLRINFDNRLLGLNDALFANDDNFLWYTEALRTHER